MLYYEMGREIETNYILPVTIKKNLIFLTNFDTHLKNLHSRASCFFLLLLMLAFIDAIHTKNKWT